MSKVCCQPGGTRGNFSRRVCICKEVSTCTWHSECATGEETHDAGMNLLELVAALRTLHAVVHHHVLRRHAVAHHVSLFHRCHTRAVAVHRSLAVGLLYVTRVPATSGWVSSQWRRFHAVEVGGRQEKEERERGRWGRKAVGSSASGLRNVVCMPWKFVTPTLHWSRCTAAGGREQQGAGSQSCSEDVALFRTSSRDHGGEKCDGRCRLLEWSTGVAWRRKW